jgi:Kef-type K+ transport system membrane component KefB
MNFGPLALVVAAGLVGPLLASLRRFGPPVVVGQIAAGLAIGTSGFGWVDPSDPLLNGLANVGFALLMFVVGTHLPVRERHLRSALVVGAGVAATVGALAALAGKVLAPLVGLDRPAVLAVLLATSSGAVALPVLQALGRSDRIVLVATVWVAIADVSTVVLLPVVLATGGVRRVLFGGLLVVVAAVGLLMLAKAGRDHRWVHRMRQLSRDRGWGLDLRISLLALFACAWLATRFGTSILIAGFAVGAVVALLGQPRRVAQQLVGIGEGFAIPLFFVHLGAQLDLGALLRSPRALAFAGALAAVAITIHVVASLVWRLPPGIGLLASAQLGVPAAVVSIGLATNQLTAAQGAAVMASLLVTLGACAVGGAVLGHSGSLTDASAPVTSM